MTIANKYVITRFSGGPFTEEMQKTFPRVINCKICASHLLKLVLEVQPDQVICESVRLYQAEKPNGVFNRLCERVGYSHILTHAEQSTHSIWARYFIDSACESGEPQQFHDAVLWCAVHSRNVLKKYKWGYCFYRYLAEKGRIQDDPEFSMRWALAKRWFDKAKVLLELVDLSKVNLTKRLLTPPMVGPVIKRLVMNFTRCTTQLDPLVKKDPTLLIKAAQKILEEEKDIDQTVLFAAALFSRHWERCQDLFPDFCQTLFEYHPTAHSSMIVMIRSCWQHVLRMKTALRHKLVSQSLPLLVCKGVNPGNYLNMLGFAKGVHQRVYYIQMMLKISEEKQLPDQHLASQLGMLLQLHRQGKLDRTHVVQVLQMFSTRQRRLFFDCVCQLTTGKSHRQLSREDQICAAMALSCYILYEVSALAQIRDASEAKRRTRVCEELAGLLYTRLEPFKDLKEVMAPIDNAIALLSGRVDSNRADVLLAPFLNGRQFFSTRKNFTRFYCGVMTSCAQQANHPKYEEKMLALLAGFDRYEMPVLEVQKVIIQILVGLDHRRIKRRMLQVIEEMSKNGSIYCTKEFYTHMLGKLKK